MQHPAIALGFSWLLLGCSAMKEPALPFALGSTSWQLLAIQSMDDSLGTTKISDPKQYTLRFEAEGRAVLKLDCNRGMGSWQHQPAAADNGSLTFGPIAATRALCPAPHLDERIVRDLAYVRAYLFKDGRLYLTLMADGGIYAWEPLSAEKETSR